MAIDQAWVTVVMLAQDLLDWTQHLYLDGLRPLGSSGSVWGSNPAPGTL